MQCEPAGAQPGSHRAPYRGRPDDTARRTVILFTAFTASIAGDSGAMSGRPLPSDETADARGFVGAECRRRRAVLRETIEAFQQAEPHDKYRVLAIHNLDRWRQQRAEVPSSLRVKVLPGDWGVVAHRMTARYGECFAVLNMANAYVPGGAYVEGASGQVENMMSSSGPSAATPSRTRPTGSPESSATRFGSTALLFGSSPSRSLAPAKVPATSHHSPKSC